MNERPLRPLAAFAEAGPAEHWRPLASFVLYRTAQTRFQVRVQRHENLTEGFAREEALIAQGLDPAKCDADEFAAGFVREFAGYLSNYELERLVHALELALARRPR